MVIVILLVWSNAFHKGESSCLMSKENEISMDARRTGDGPLS